MLKVEFDRRDVVKVNIDDIDEDNNDLSAAYVDGDEIYILKRRYQYLKKENNDDDITYLWARLNNADRRYSVIYYYHSFKEALEGAGDYDVYIGNNLQELLFEIFDKLVGKDD